MSNRTLSPSARSRWRVVHPTNLATREPAPPGPEGELAAEKVPGVDPPQPVSILRVLMPVIMVAAMLAMVFIMVRMSGTVHPMFLVMPVMMAMGMMSMIATPQGKDPDETRRVYLRHLAQLRAAALTNAARQRALAEHLNPAPDQLWGLASGPRLWERARDDSDALHVRIGVGAAALATPVAVPDSGSPEDLDPVCAVAVRHTVRSVATVPKLPVVVNLAAFHYLSIAGPDARGLARALVCHLAFHHGPEAVGVEVTGKTAHWQWLKWLPHIRNPGEAAFRVLVVDERGTTGTEDFLVGGDYTCIIEVGSGAPTALRTLARDEGLALTAGDALVAHTDAGLEELGIADTASTALATQFARSMAHCRRPGLARGAAANDLLDLLGLGGLDEDHGVRLWAAPPREKLRVPIGITRGASAPQPVLIDLRESAHGGMGPHGLCIGATGSGKSELLRTLAAALAATHSPEELNFVLVDFKGGATFLGLDGLPHTSAVITNLEEEAVLVERMHDAIAGELNRRQEILRAAGGIANITDYNEQAGRTEGMARLPALVIIVDEFSELLANHPDFADLFVAVGRLGRSLGVHLLLASQRLEEGRLRGLDSHLSYRIGLRTFSAAESRQVLGVVDAHELPRTPGAGFLKFGPDPVTGFQAAYVSGPPRPPAAETDDCAGSGVGGAEGAGKIAGADGALAVRPFELPPSVDVLDEPENLDIPRGMRASEGTEPDPEAASGPSVLEVIVRAAREEARQRGLSAHRIWLPPLQQRVELAGVVDDHGFLRAAVGIIDRPYHQRQDPLVVDFTVGGGHLAVAGGPKTGKSTALRTIVTALAATHPTSKVAFYVIDSGRELETLTRLPHVAGRAGRGEAERARRILDEVGTLIDDHPGGEPSRHVLVILDGWHNLAADLEDRLDDIARIAADGPSAGVHLVISTTRWTALRPAIRDLIAVRLELRLAEAMDSLIDRKAQQKVPQQPGRGLTPQKEHMLWADSTAQDIAHVTQEAARRGDRPVPALKVLPEDLEREELLAASGPAAGESDEADTTGASPGIVLGLGGPRLESQYWRPESATHLAVVGARGSGKTTALDTVMAGIVERGRKANRIVLIDPKRAHLGTVPDEFLAAYAANTAAARKAIAQTAETLRERLPGADISPSQLAGHDWWHGPEIFVVIDDAELIADHEFAELVELLPHSADIGLHVVYARKSGGFARAAFQPVVGGLRDQNPMAIVLSADREEGAIFGIKPKMFPPGRGQMAGGAAIQVARVAKRGYAQGGVR